MWMALIVTPIQIVGGRHARPEHAGAPAGQDRRDGGPFRKLPEGRAPLILFGLPDDAAGETRYKVEIPILGSLILTHCLDARGSGPQGLSRRRTPDVRDDLLDLPHHGGRSALPCWGSVCGRPGRAGAGGSTRRRWLHRAAVAMGPSGFVAVLAGWITTEVGPPALYRLWPAAHWRKLQRRCRRMRSAPR